MKNAQQTYSLYVHSPTHSTDEVILNSEVFPDVKEDDYVQIYDPNETEHKLILRVTSLQSKGGRMEVSILKSIAEAFKLASYTKVHVDIIDRKNAETDFVEMAFRKQFIQRGDMIRFKKRIVGKSVHINQNIDLEGVNMVVQEIRSGDNMMKCGIITEKTNVVFRSRSARVFWLVQISAEMWEIDKYDNLYFEVFLNKFVGPILDKWKALGVTHSLSIIFFARTFYHGKRSDDKLDANSDCFDASLQSLRSIDDDVSYQDFYKIVLDNCTYSDKTTFIRNLKREFWKFPGILDWRLETGVVKGRKKAEAFSQGSNEYFALPSGSSGGNVLEAINTTLNVLDKHFMDRDLERTGNSIVIISPGVGFFEVESKLSRITKQRMMDNGIGLDFISLSQPPLHITPLFYELPSTTQEVGCYKIPHWINLQFVNVDDSVKNTRGNYFISALTEPVACLNENANSANFLKEHFSFLPFPFFDILQDNVSHLEISDDDVDKKSDDKRNMLCRLMSLPCALKRHLQTHSSHVDCCNVSEDDCGHNNSMSSPDIAARKYEWGRVYFAPFSTVHTSEGKESAKRDSSVGDKFSEIALPEQLRGITEKLPMHLINTSEELLQYLSSSDSTTDIDQDVLTALMAYFDEKVISESSEKKVYPKKKSFYKQSVDDSSLAITNRPNNPNFEAMREKSRKDFEGLKKKRDSLSKKSPDYCSETLRGIDNSDTSLSIIPDQMDKHSAKVTVRYPDGSGRTFRAFAASVTDGKCSTEPNAGCSPPWATGERGMTRRNSHTEKEKYNPSLMASPRSSRGNRRQLGEAVRGKFAAEGGFSAFKTTDLKLNRSPERAKIAIAKLHDSSSLLPPTTRTQPIAIPNSKASNGSDDGGTVGESVLGDDTASDNARKPLAASWNADSSALAARRHRADSLSGPNSETPRPMSSSFESGNLRTADANENYRSEEVKLGINPFHLEDGQELLRMWVRHRRRWAHALPQSNVPEKSSIWDLNWKSLCQPVILPLTTDDLPSSDTIRRKYTVANYSLVLDPVACPFSRPESLLAEMVNQRLAQEFQVIDNSQHNIRPFKQLVVGTAEKEAPDHLFSILSMGHRIHFLCYIPSRGTVYVYRYMSRVGVNDDNSTYSYRYRVWSRQFGRFVVMHQNFYQFPEPEHAWNLTDEVLSGNQDLLSDNCRAKRIRLAIVPCNGISGQQYQEHFEKLIAYLNKYSSEPIVLKYEQIANSRKNDQNIRLWLRRPNSKGASTNIIDQPQWVYARCEGTYCLRKVFHLDIHWIACIASLVDDFINMLFRRCGSWGLRLIQIPEFFCVSNLQMHPFRGNPQIFVPNLTTLEYTALSVSAEGHWIHTTEKKTISEAVLYNDYSSPTHLIERVLLLAELRYNKDKGINEVNDWVPDEKQRTDWSAMGLPEPPCHLKERCPNLLPDRYSSKNWSPEATLIPSKGAEVLPPAKSSRFGDSVRTVASYVSNHIHSATSRIGLNERFGLPEDKIAKLSKDEAKAVERDDRIMKARECCVSYGNRSESDDSCKGGSTPPLMSSSPSRPLGMSHSFISSSPMSDKNSPTMAFHEALNPVNDISSRFSSSLGYGDAPAPPPPARRLRRHIHYDNQYMQLMGYAVVRVAANGFVWLQSSTPRVSDVEKLGADDKRNMSERILERFCRECKEVQLCYEILIETIEASLDLSCQLEEVQSHPSAEIT